MDKIICLGKNYAEHAKELGDAFTEKPVLFLKPPSSLLQGSSEATVHARLPQERGSVHHECEIVLRVNARGKIEAYTLGLDMTLRDQQSALKKAGHPWETSKVFDHSAIVGSWRPFVSASHLDSMHFELKVNQTRRQRGSSSEMILPIDSSIYYVQEYFSLRDGDLIFTGTPVGVGPVVAGDVAELFMGAERLLLVEWG